MAPKTKNTALATQPKNTAIAQLEDWEIELQSKARAERANESSGLARITHEDGILAIDGKPVKDNKIQVMIADYVFTKAFYEKAYRKGDSQTPACYSFATSEAGEKGMTPHEQSPKPVCENCAQCEHNVFGTALQGAGKRCKDERRLGVIFATEDSDSIQKAEVRAINIPPGSLKNWGNYLKAVPQITPTENVRCLLTEIAPEKSGGGHALTFKPIAKLDKEFVKAVLARSKSVTDLLITPYPTLTQEEQAPASPKRTAKTR